MEYKICKNWQWIHLIQILNLMKVEYASHCVGYYSKNSSILENLLSDKEGLIKLKNYIKKRDLQKKVNMIVLLD